MRTGASWMMTMLLDAPSSSRRETPPHPPPPSLSSPPRPLPDSKGLAFTMLNQSDVEDELESFFNKVRFFAETVVTIVPSSCFKDPCLMLTPIAFCKVWKVSFTCPFLTASSEFATSDLFSTRVSSKLRILIVPVGLPSVSSSVTPQ